MQAGSRIIILPCRLHLISEFVPLASHLHVGPKLVQIEVTESERPDISDYMTIYDTTVEMCQILLLHS